MHLTSLLLAAMASIACAQNAFSMSSLSTIPVGMPYNITWAPSEGTKYVTLLLRQGAAADLSTVSTIASSIANSGSFAWTPSSSLVSGSDYALQIQDADDPSIVNYSGHFAIASAITASSSTASPTSASAASSSLNSSLPAASTFGSLSSYSNSSTTALASDASLTVVSSAGAAATTTDGAAATTGAAASSSSSGSQAAASGQATDQAPSEPPVSLSTGGGGSSSSATKNAAVAVKSAGALVKRIGIAGLVIAVL